MAGQLKKAHLSDANAHLMMAYKAIKSDVEKVIKLLRKHARLHSEGYYLAMRKQRDRDHIEAAARLIYLNKTCYNGLYRVNKKGEFNAPMGTYENPNICDAANLRNVARALRKATLKWQGFEEINPKAGDFVYCDPPYDATYSGYTSSGFGEEGQRTLAAKAAEWSRAGVFVMLSNSDTDLIRKLYPKRRWKIIEVMAPRVISCSGKDRKPCQELLISNG